MKNGMSFNSQNKTSEKGKPLIQFADQEQHHSLLIVCNTNLNPSVPV
jgi:hypothetical protein